MNTNELIKNAKKVNTLLKVFQVICIVVGGISCLFIPLSYFTSFFKEDMSTLDFGHISFVFKDVSQFVNTGEYELAIVLSLGLAVIACVMIFIGLKVLREIVEPMCNGEPFIKGVSYKLKRLAYIILFGGAFYQAADVISHFILFNAYNIMDMLKGQLVSVTYNINIDFTFIFVATLFFILSLVFKYGEALQKESDETL